MASELDKFTYLTVYRQDYGGVNKNAGNEPKAETGKVPCKQKANAAENVGRPHEKNTQDMRYCRPGVGMPPKGAFADGTPTNIEASCNQGRSKAVQPPTFTKEEIAEMMYKACESGKNFQNAHPQTGAAGRTALPCDPAPNRPVPIGQFGGQFEGPANREPLDPNENPCCPPGKPESGPQDYGPAWIRDRANETRMTGGKEVTFEPEVAKLIDPEPVTARVSCAPESEVSRFDQPNTFMKKLYDKYPYLYQILRDTPPEELIARVFKDRFLSTYQVDYLHMGVGKEHFPKGGSQKDEQFESPEGEPEPKTIPGITYRPNKRTEFGKKKTGLKMKELENGRDSDEPVVVKEEPWISEYMASISKLGGEIITDKLYAVEATNRKLASGKYNL
ncbi:UNVERIFIED_CONTAM: hypothetical protein PYX00_010198 [Menopon gallinae]|uniref:Uncharacterized protein n=1 Tax=Menopon gallinae TaxID=328185 RepID=A0AAW2HEG1_9NEOP